METNQLVAVGDSGTIITSGDGDLWVQRTSGVTYNLNNVTWGNNCFSKSCSWRINPALKKLVRIIHQYLELTNSEDNLDNGNMLRV